MECDIVVIGGGIVGSAAAYELGKRDLGKVMLLEQVYLRSLQRNHYYHV